MYAMWSHLVEWSIHSVDINVLYLIMKWMNKVLQHEFKLCVAFKK